MSILLEVRVEGDVRVTGYLALDSFVGGSAHGGLRIANDVSADLLQRAAHTMTLKYGWVHLPVGGAKAGIHIAPGSNSAERASALRAFGQAIRPYLRTRMYVPGEDMGSTEKDIKILLASAGLKPLPGSLMHTTSGMYTGVGVYAAGIAAASSLGLACKGLKVTIEGLGNVGASAAMWFHEAGARVIAVSTINGALFNENGLNVPQLLSERQALGDEVVLQSGFGDVLPAESLVHIPTDILCPCAIMHSITITSARSITARVICPGANVPTTDEAEETLLKRGVLFLPDFVANCGGILGSSMSRAGLRQEQVATIVNRRVAHETTNLIVAARKVNGTLHSVAIETATQRFLEAKARYEHGSPARVITRAAVGIYRRGLIPRPLLAPLGRWYYDSRFRTQDTA